jgi:hypothetical protein
MGQWAYLDAIIRAKADWIFFSVNTLRSIKKETFCSRRCRFAHRERIKTQKKSMVRPAIPQTSPQIDSPTDLTQVSDLQIVFLAKHSTGYSSRQADLSEQTETEGAYECLRCKWSMDFPLYNIFLDGSTVLISTVPKSTCRNS